MADDIYVLDTSALIQVTDIVGGQFVVRLLKRLDPEVDAGRLVFPKEVVSELEAYGDMNDPKLLWAKRHEKAVVPKQPLFNDVKRVLADPLVRHIIDPKKAAGVDEADPYLLAYGLRLKELGHDVTVLTEDREDRPGPSRRDPPGKLSLATACGVLKLFSMPMQPYLLRLGVLKGITKKKTKKKKAPAKKK